MRRLLGTLTIIAVLAVTSATAAEPKAIKTQEVESGVELSVFRVPLNESTNQEIWVYRPSLSEETEFPAVFIAPAGGTLITSPPLSEADRPEHLPWVRAGFIVVSYTMRGLTPETDEVPALLKAATEFQAARAGLSDAKSALDFALEAVPAIDRGRVFAAGHSSAASLALLWAATDSRIRGAVAFAPVWNVVDHLGAQTVGGLNTRIPGYADFLRWSSPSNHAEKLKVPVMLFHAKDDEVVPYERSVAAVTAIRAGGGTVEFRSAETGGHYQSMISDGIPAGSRWLKSTTEP